MIKEDHLYGLAYMCLCVVLHVALAVGLSEVTNVCAISIVLRPSYGASRIATIENFYYHAFISFVDIASQKLQIVHDSTSATSSGT